METVFQSRADQAANFLRKKIRDGYWQAQLPAQRMLARELGISRRSLSSALTELEREGLIENRMQSGTYVVRIRGTKATPPLSVGIVFSSNLKTFVDRHLIMLEAMRQVFQARKVHMEIHYAPQLRGNRVSDRFKKLLLENNHQCWVLNSPTAAMQMCCKNHSIPAVVLGVGHEASGLPNVGVDHFALCRHALGEILRRGHRRIALILPHDEKGEDVQSREGFAASLEHSSHPDALLTFEYHDQTIPGVCRLANRLLARRPRPTAWMVCRQGHFFTIFSHLLHQKVDIPQTISLISRDSDIYLSDIVPEPTRYVANIELMARQCARVALRIMTGQSIQGKKLRVMPDFVPGQTFGTAPVELAS